MVELSDVIRMKDAFQTIQGVVVSFLLEGERERDVRGERRMTRIPSFTGGGRWWVRERAARDNERRDLDLLHQELSSDLWISLLQVSSEEERGSRICSCGWGWALLVCFDDTVPSEKGGEMNEVSQISCDFDGNKRHIVYIVIEEVLWMTNSCFENQGMNLGKMDGSSFSIVRGFAVAGKL